MSFDNAPLISALLVSSQMHAEYQEALEFRRYAATITADSVYKRQSLEARSKSEDRSIASISHLRSITLFTTPQPEGAFWMAIESFAKEMIADHAPRLETLQIALRIMAEVNPMVHGHMRRNNYIANYEACTHPLFRLRSPPPTLPGEMALVRRGEGYLLGHDKHSTTYFMPFPGQVEKDHVKHAVARVGMYGYTKLGSIETLMEKRDVVERWPMGKYPDDVLELFGEEADAVRRWPEEIREWKEMLGNEVVEEK